MTVTRLRRVVPEPALVVKATLAAAVAWWVARALPGHDVPYYAPLAALIGVYPTTLSSLREAGRFTLGYVTGALVGVPASLWLSPSVGAVLVVVPLSMVAAGGPWLAGQRVNVPFVALFVLLLGGGDPVTFAASRMVDVVIGVTLGLAVNTVWPPAVRDRATERAARHLAERVAALLRDTAEEVRWCEPLPPRHRARQAWAVRVASHALAEAEAEQAESRRLNLRHGLAPRRRRAAPRPANRVLHGAAEQARVLAREAEHGGAASAASPCVPEFREKWSALLELLAELALHWGDTGEPPADERLTEALERYRDMRATAMGHGRTDGTPQRWVTETQLCALALQLVFELGREPEEPMAPESLGVPERGPLPTPPVR
jgi:uncharacterized membrane protein YccC